MAVFWLVPSTLPMFPVLPDLKKEDIMEITRARAVALSLTLSLALVGCSGEGDTAPAGGQGGPAAAGGEEAAASAGQPPGGGQAVERGPRTQPGTEMGIYTPEQHPLYDGRFIASGSRIYQVGTLADESPWDHMGDDAADLREVGGTIELDVNEIENTGTFRAELQLPEGEYVVTLDRFEEFSPCQDGGVAAWLFEHGNSGCGDANWPKSILYVAGWGWGDATLNGETLHDDYQIHFMVTQGMRDRRTLQVRPEMTGPTGGGAVNPAAFQLDFYIRSPERNEANHPDREVFDHFFAMEVTWR